MIVDAREECHDVTLTFGDTTTTSRSWDITVTQYKCSELSQKGGPPGCLQYYTGANGRISSFNFPPTATTITGSVTHLSNQDYTMCIRRESGYCYICYTLFQPTSTSITNQASFGLSVGATDAGNSAVNTDCGTDYLMVIPTLPESNEDPFQCFEFYS